MTASGTICHYALGNTDCEHERLIRQAAHLAPLTERLFREAGIGAGQRVLDLGSGVGDIAMLAARLVGSSGEVLGVERDPRSIALARFRVAEAGLNNVSFTESDVSQVRGHKRFNAVVGRFILMYLPDPVAVLCSVSELVRPGGVLAFQEISWAPFLPLTAHLPLRSAAVSLTHLTFLRSGANPEIGLALYQIFQEAGLPGPSMHMEIPLGNDPDLTRLLYDIISSMRPQIRRLGLAVDKVGDFATLAERLQAELEASKSVVPWIAPFVAAWTRKPIDEAVL